MDYSNENIQRHVDREVFHLVGSAADELGRECYVVGGYVRDIILDRPSTDIDFVTVGSGIEVAKAVAGKFGRKRCSLSVFKTYGTAQVKHHGLELEFVGARRESYQRDSRNPIVEDGTLDDDQKRRDFTINAMAISLNAVSYGKLLDPFDGIGDLKCRIIRTPLDPDITFSDDPLRMMRAVRFATQLNFDIYPDTKEAIKRNCKRIKIITKERIAVELMKIVKADKPSRGFRLLNECGLLEIIFPSLAALRGVETVRGRGHKDNFDHTMQVLDNVAAVSNNEWLRWAAVMHDIAKPVTKAWDDKLGWTFHNHNYIGEKMVPKIFGHLRLPLNEHMKYVKKLVGLHMRPIALVEDTVTDSAVRRLLFDAGDDIDDLMTLCNADITSKNQQKVRRFHDNFELVKQKLIDIEEKDRVRNFQPPIDGQEIMDTFGLAPSMPVGQIKDAIKDAILDGKIANSYAQAYGLMAQKASELGLKPVTTDTLCTMSVETPVGTLTLAADDIGIATVAVTADTLHETEHRLGKTAMPCPTPLLRQCERQLGEYFAGGRRDFDLPMHLAGTDFQLQVWKALTRVPYGTTCAYKDIATAIGAPGKSRAVANAIRLNPIALIVPCHRVIGSNGKLTGYRGGISNKQTLLTLESCHKAPIAKSAEDIVRQ